MTDVPDSDDIVDAIAVDAEAGVQSFSDGTNSVSAMDLEKRLAIASKIGRRTSPLTAGDLLRGMTKMNGPRGGFQ